MKKLQMFGVVVAMVIAAGYVGQAQKAMVVWTVRLESQLEKGQITQQQYDELTQKNTFGKTLLNPRKVLSVD